MTTTIKAQIRKLDLPMQVKLFIAILKTLDEPRIKRLISFEEFLYNREYQNIVISNIMCSGIEKFCDGMPDNDITSYTIDQKNSLFFKLFIC